MVFAEILLREDVPFDVVRRWDVDHTSTVINFRQLGLKVRAYFQHKSGDSSAHGSSRVLAVALAWCLDDEDQRGRFFYLAQGRQTLADCKFVVYDDTFNFESKILDFDGSMYYCGNFLVMAQGYVRLVPDPLKAIIKLGRFDLFCRQQVEEYWRSFSDNNYSFASQQYG